MASAQSYISTSIQNMKNDPNMTIQQIIQQLGGYNNPAVSEYTPADLRDVTDPTLMTIAQYLNALGADGYTYQYSDFLDKANAATKAGYDAQFNALDDAQRNYYQSMGTAQATAADTIRNQYSHAIQQGISKGMQQANILSTLLGTSQAAAQEATQLAQDRYQTGQEYRAQILKDASDAIAASNNAYGVLMDNIRQLYNDDIQQKTADLEYNASVIDSNAQYAANKYAADTNYASGINTNASGIFNNNQSVLSQIMAAASQAAAQDNYSNAYLAAAKAAADAQRYAANQAYAAARSGSSSGGASGGGTSGSGAPIAEKPGSTNKTIGVGNKPDDAFNSTLYTMWNPFVPNANKSNSLVNGAKAAGSKTTVGNALGTALYPKTSTTSPYAGVNAALGNALANAKKKTTSPYAGVNAALGNALANAKKKTKTTNSGGGKAYPQSYMATK